MTGTKPAVEMVISHLALGGAENVALTIAETLKDNFAFEFFVVLEQGSEFAIGKSMAQRLSAIDIPIHFGTRKDFKKGGALQAALQLRRRLTARKPSLVHVHTEIAELSIAAATAIPGSVQRIPILRTIHNTKLWPQWERLGKLVEHRLRKAAIAAVSQGALAAAQAAAPRRQASPLRHERIIYNGVRAFEQKVTGDTSQPPKILFAGRFERQKGADLVVPILERAAEQWSGLAEVTLAGSGALGETISAQVAQSTLAWPITINDGIPDLAQRIREFDVVLIPSRFEGLPLLAVEALLAGIPVVASAAPGLSEVVPPSDEFSASVDDIDGLAKCLVNCLNNLPASRQHVARRQPELRAQFSVEHMTWAYRQYYSQLMGMI